ncbi:unnamed protein product [Thlaspi arvense]|uniref:HSF-type DNA-binding domain-containing protein n=1 Tax=Thlaspi arvense TaxID=13288 RepID=A0AAU9T7G1_THLAR|nr:unnamed protein product [Thlaspi arvense]
MSLDVSEEREETRRLRLPEKVLLTVSLHKWESLCKWVLNDDRELQVGGYRHSESDQSHKLFLQMSLQKRGCRSQRGDEAVEIAGEIAVVRKDGLINKISNMIRAMEIKMGYMHKSPFYVSGTIITKVFIMDHYFPAKVYEMVDDPSTDSIVSWSESGESFIVWNETEFCRDVLPRFSVNMEMKNFTSRLEAMRFRRVESSEQWEYAHECLVRGKPELASPEAYTQGVIDRLKKSVFAIKNGVWDLRMDRLRLRLEKNQI